MNKNIGFLSGNSLKVIACISMLIDHIGLILSPYIEIFRVIGRIAFPIFAFLIAEGCYYTKNKLKYFLLIFIIGIICHCVSNIIAENNYFNILITFSFSIVLVYLLNNLKETLKTKSLYKSILLTLFLIFLIYFVYVINTIVEIDYGFWGIMLPVFVSIPDNKSQSDKIIMAGIGLVLLSAVYGGIQFYSIFALIFLFLYSGKRGTLNLKYFFYVFYPAHIGILWVINMILN